MKSISQMSDSELELEKSKVKSSLNNNPFAAPYLEAIQEEQKRRSL
jgi:hypothetical protein